MLPWGPRLRRDGLVPWGLAQLGNIEMTLLQTVPSRIIKKRKRKSARTGDHAGFSPRNQNSTGLIVDAPLRTSAPSRWPCPMRTRAAGQHWNDVAANGTIAGHKKKRKRKSARTGDHDGFSPRTQQSKETLRRSRLVGGALRITAIVPVLCKKKNFPPLPVRGPSVELSWELWGTLPNIRWEHHNFYFKKEHVDPSNNTKILLLLWTIINYTI